MRNWFARQNIPLGLTRRTWHPANIYSMSLYDLSSLPLLDSLYGPMGGEGVGPTSNFFKHQPDPTFVQRASLCIYQTNKTFAINNIHTPNKNRAKKRTHKNIILITSKHKSFLFIYFIFIYISLFYFFCLCFDARKIIALVM